MQLEGQVAIVTGGGVRLGRAIALALARAGMDVCVHARSSLDEAEHVCREIRQIGRRGTTVQADLASPETAARHIMQHAGRTLGPATVLINSAAIFEPDNLSTVTDELWQRQLCVNLQSPVWLSRELTGQLPADQAGCIINLADWRGERPVAGHLSYTVSKAGLIAATRVLAQELAPRVRVNAIAPGAILPPPAGSREDFDQLAEVIPLARTGTPDHVVQAVLYLLRNDFVTGEVLHVTGGQQLQVPRR